ncbi:MAG: shikimate kinase [Paludibacteraceae bacterium]|nr:shikimate kinase [Paludibacteraceae bacterium]
MNRIFLIGYMGCGKTTTGKRIAKKYGLDFIDLDHYIENRYFKTIPQLFEEKGEDGFRQIEHNMLIEVSEFENAVISTGGGAACFFDNMDIMNKSGETIYLKASPENLFKYLKTATQNRPLLQGKNDEELLQFIKEGLEKREPFYMKAKHIMDYMDMSDVLFDQLLK